MWPQILLAGIPAVASIVAAIIATHYASKAKESEATAEHIRDLENRNAEHRFGVYEPMLELLRKILDPQERAAVTKDERAMIAQMSKFSTWVVIFGSDEAVETYERFMQSTYASAPPTIMIRLYTDFVIAARRDLGNPSTKLTGEHVMGMRLKDLYEPENLGAFTLSFEELCKREQWTPPWTARVATATEKQRASA